MNPWRASYEAHGRQLYRHKSSSKTEVVINPSLASYEAHGLQRRPVRLEHLLGLVLHRRIGVHMHPLAGCRAAEPWYNLAMYKMYQICVHGTQPPDNMIYDTYYASQIRYHHVYSTRGCRAANVGPTLSADGANVT